MPEYRRNHYVPKWYQHRFFPSSYSERKFYYLDLKPETCISRGHRYARKHILRRGPRRAFYADDLYTTQFGGLKNTEIEQHFFGPIDDQGRKAVEYFHGFEHPSVSDSLFEAMLSFMGIQKLRTPKGLAYLASATQSKHPNDVLFQMQNLQDMFCATWTECIWSIIDASNSTTKFILSDHPVTVYNRDCFPGSAHCRGHNDPDVILNGTHTIFPLSLDKALLLTNLSWVRNPYGNPKKSRPNPRLFDSTMFSFTDIQTGRLLADDEVIRINHIIKIRAHRYVAAFEKDWLYPECQATLPRWDRLTDDHLLMPDPRSVSFTDEIVVGNNQGAFFAMDAYGRRPGNPAYRDARARNQEWDTFLAFQGEYARLHGPKRRGKVMSFGGDPDFDDADYHKYHLSLERFKPKRTNNSRKRL